MAGIIDVPIGNIRRNANGYIGYSVDNAAINVGHHLFSMEMIRKDVRCFM
jgi:hypothetical protein